jgi:hypothetical protein
MSGILTIARLVCKDSQAREKAIEAFRKIIAHTTPNEPEVLQYVCTLPVDDSLGTEIYMIEECVVVSELPERRTNVPRGMQIKQQATHTSPPSPCKT